MTVETTVIETTPKEQAQKSVMESLKTMLTNAYHTIVNWIKTNIADYRTMNRNSLFKIIVSFVFDFCVYLASWYAMLYIGASSVFGAFVLVSVAALLVSQIVKNLLVR